MGEQVTGRLDLEIVGARLHDAREHAGLSAYGLAKLTGLSDTAIYLIEAGSRMPNIDTASRLAHALGMTTSELIGERRTTLLEEGPEMGLARRAAESLGALKLDDPVGFLGVMAALSPQDQQEIYELALFKMARSNRPPRRRKEPPPGSAEEELRRPRR